MVRFAGRTLHFGDDEVVGFGRTSGAGDGAVGWGFPGRFIELGPSVEVHRVWGSLVPFAETWRIRSLGSLNPVVVLRPGHLPYRLEPFSDARREAGVPPDELIVSSGSFQVDLRVGRVSATLNCEIDRLHPDPTSVEAARSGAATINLAERLAAEITLLEYRVLWAMSADRRRGIGSEPVSYTRIERALSLESQKQAVSAVERLKRRFREFDLLSDEIPSDLQRRIMCERTDDLGLLRLLERRHGPVA